MTQPVEIRLPTVSRIYMFCFGLFVIGTMLIPAITSRRSNLAFAVPASVFVCLLIRRIERMKLVADESGLLVRNFHRTWRFSWNDVEDFRIGLPAMAMPYGRSIHVLLRNREIVTPDVTVRFWILFGGRARLDQTVQSLRLWLRPPRPDS